MVEELSYEELVNLYRDPHILCEQTTRHTKYKQD